MQKKIIAFYSVIGILGLMSELFLSYGANYIITIFKSHTVFVNLGIMGSDWYKDLNDLNLLNILFYATLLTGVIRYAVNNKNSGIVRFGASLMLLSCVITLLSWLLTFAFYFQGWQAWGYWSQFAVNLGLTIFFIWAHITIIRSLNRSQKLKETENRYGDSIVYHLVPTGKWQRFFHLLMDVILVMLLFSPILKLFIRVNELNFIPEFLENTLGERGTLWVIIVLFRFIYYVVSESVLQASPAKFLTGSRVVDTDGNKVNTGTIVMRTLSRFVPFEALSFLGGRDGWHDRWANTNVVKEE